MRVLQAELGSRGQEEAGGGCRGVWGWGRELQSSGRRAQDGSLSRERLNSDLAEVQVRGLVGGGHLPGRGRTYGVSAE